MLYIKTQKEGWTVTRKCLKNKKNFWKGHVPLKINRSEKIKTKFKLPNCKTMQTNNTKATNNAFEPLLLLYHILKLFLYKARPQF